MYNFNNSIPKLYFKMVILNAASGGLFNSDHANIPSTILLNRKIVKSIKSCMILVRKQLVYLQSQH